MWLDGTQNRRTTTWSIDKAAGSLSISDNSTTLTTGDTDSFTIATVGDGAITVTSSDTSVATVSQSGSTVTVTAVAAGHTAITVSVAEGTNYLAPSDVTYNLTVQSNISNTLNNNSWQTISEISQAGDGDLYWDVGDAKQITLNGQIGDAFTATNLSLCVFILHFNYKMNGTAENNIIWSGFKSALTDGADVVLFDSKVNSTSTDGTKYFNMNHWGTGNYGGWKGFDLRYDVLGATSTAPSDYGKAHTTSNVGYDATAETLTNPKTNTLLAALPADLRNVIKLWSRWIDATGNKSNTDAGIKETVDAITLLAEAEVFATRKYANQYEQNHLTQMAYYANGNSAVRYKYNATTAGVIWLLASPIYSAVNNICTVYGGNIHNSISVTNPRGLAPAFKT
ncbi:MAG: hypothetical protein IJ563_09345 [Selenomonadaceae bacterium]|nr:hypothetical protein [Selenomonadaceae bacterium]